MQEKEEIALNGHNEQKLPRLNGDAQSNVQHVSDIIGDTGRWQKTIFAFFFVCGMFSAFNSLGLAFYAPNQEFWCHRPSWAAFNVSKGAQLLEVRTNGTELMKCRDASNQTCQRWEYDDEEFPHTIIEQFDLVCERSWLISFAKSVYMVGILFAVLLSQVADKYGRFPVVFGGIIIEVLSGLLSAFSVSIEMYIVSRFFLAVGNAARWGSGFVIILEVIGPKQREILGIAIQFGWALGYIVMPFVAYFIRDFRYLQLACTLPEIVCIYICWQRIPESPRWQLTNGRFKAAEISLRKAAHENSLSNKLLDEEVEVKLKKLLNKFEEERELQKKNITLVDLWRTPNLRKKTALLYFTWAVNGFVYYGLSFNTNSLGGNIYVNFFLSGAVEFPAYWLTIVVLKKYGRKPPLAAAMFGAGIVFLLTLPLAWTDWVWLQTALAMVGKFFITGSFAIIYLYSGEIYPTVARTVGLGSSSMFARFGAICAPFVKELGEATHITVGLAIFGLLSVVNGFLVLHLPETKGKQMPDTLQQAEDE